MHVLDAAERLLPQLELDSHRQLREARVEVALKRVRVRKVDRVRMVGRARDALQVLTQHLAQTAELGLALVLQTKVQRLVCNLLVWRRRARGVLEDVKLGRLCRREEFEPRRDQRAVLPVTLLVLAHTAQQTTHTVRASR